MNLAIIDTLGLTYNGETLSSKGLGGSESAVILMSKELTKLGISVTVFCNCDSPGLNQDGVFYRDLSEINNQSYEFDVVISSRSVRPFCHNEELSTHNYYYGNLLWNNPHRVLWMHDTFCTGDNLIEQLILEGRLHRIFTLSDFHTNYVLNCDHGHHRHFETLKPYIFQTRNGIGNMGIPDIDVKNKDPDLFVYNASVSKGLEPLLTKIWPEFNTTYPNTKLVVIGGYYQMALVDEQQTKWLSLKEEYDNRYNISFTGVIPQQEISSILSKASFMLYPTAFPETFGISTLEALVHKVPIITTDFGALETTAIAGASYKIPNSIIKNNVYPDLNEDSQLAKFKTLLVEAYESKFLHKQKMEFASVVSDIATWGTVALQWKQFFYKELDLYMAPRENEKANVVNWKVNKVFQSKFTDHVDLPSIPEKHVLIIAPVYNAESYISRCIESVANQDYTNYTMFIVDDSSTDNTVRVVHDTVNKSLDCGAKGKFFLECNSENIGAVANHLYTLLRNAGPDDIVILLDGDDWLVNDNQILKYYNYLYSMEEVDFTYGSCISRAFGHPLVGQDYPQWVINNRSYRDYEFEWGMPYTHLRTFHSSLITPDWYESPEFYNLNGDIVKAGGDNALFYTLLERANNPKAVKFAHCVYNDAHALNDMRVYPEEQNIVAERIRSMKPSGKKRVLIAIPCKNDIHAETFKSIYDLTIPSNIEVDFQYFWGYRVDQIRNLVVHYTVENGYDYLLSIDHDMILPKDTLVRLLNLNTDVATGVYIQRLDPPAYELYNITGHRISHIDPNSIITIGGCGFGGVLLTADIIKRVGHPQFEYHVALDHANTVSEDTDFCNKVRAVGGTIKCDTSLLYGHIGERIFMPQVTIDPVKQRLLDLHNQDLLPIEYQQYMRNMSQVIEPEVIYDLGSCVKHWTRHANAAWPDAELYCIDAMDEVRFLYDREHFVSALLGSDDGRPVEFYQNLEHPGGNSVYKENPELSPRATELFPENSKVRKVIRTLDNIAISYGWKYPSLIKLDIQGSELETLKGAHVCLLHANDILIEMQHVDYNIGAPKVEEITTFLNNYGFHLVSRINGSHLGVDADYHFSRNPEKFHSN